jgi:hypothetical protein
MKRLRHPIRAITEPFGKAGLIVAVLALVLATTGAAFAASALNAKQKKEVEKIAKKYAGKPGAQGPAGANGPAGSAGTAGTKGADGTPGTNGTNGTNGTPGTSVTNTALSEGNAHCPKGGAELKVGTGTPTFACNGQTGFTETLPAGKTETGTWVISQQEVVGSALPTYAISFPIPLAEGASEAENGAVFLDAGETGEAPAQRTREVEVEPGVTKKVGELCAGSVEEPSAAPGKLCIYTIELNGPEPTVASLGGEANAYSPTGAFMNWFVSGPGGDVFANGSWAVTASTP